MSKFRVSEKHRMGIIISLSCSSEMLILDKKCLSHIIFNFSSVCPLIIWFSLFVLMFSLHREVGFLQNYFISIVHPYNKERYRTKHRILPYLSYRPIRTTRYQDVLRKESFSQKMFLFKTQILIKDKYYFRSVESFCVFFLYFRSSWVNLCSYKCILGR